MATKKTEKSKKETKGELKKKVEAKPKTKSKPPSGATSQKVVKTIKKAESKEVTKSDSKKPKKKGRKCCPHCPDYENCEEKGVCCEYCDFLLNGKCTFGKKKGIPCMDNQVDLPDYRGDDFGIDDYGAYESVYD